MVEPHYERVPAAGTSRGGPFGYNERPLARRQRWNAVLIGVFLALWVCGIVLFTSRSAFQRFPSPTHLLSPKLLPPGALRSMDVLRQQGLLQMMQTAGQTTGFTRESPGSFTSQLTASLPNTDETETPADPTGVSSLKSPLELTVTALQPQVTYLGVSSTRRHGVLEPRKNGQLLWTPQPSAKTANMAVVLQKGGGFNLVLSDSLPLDRDPQDNRDASCRGVTYALNTLPPASVIIVFYNEPFSTLLRSVHSVLNLTPQEILLEIVLVDDGSTKPHIRSDQPEVPSLLEEYVQRLPKTRLVRNPTRTGIVGARLLGIESAKAEIFVILDSHIEVQPGWLEPLVADIQQNRNHVIMPQIDGIDPKTFTYNAGGIGCTLGLIWKLMEHGFDRKPAPGQRRPQATDVVESPTMAGGLFAANKQYFMEVGSYDTGMTYWGVENVELSFRLWQCGGALTCAPCSRVYHIFRQGGAGYSIPDPHSVNRNKLRMMAVWMDEFADLSWRVLGKPVLDIGDISSRLELKKNLKCKPFSYFLNTVWPESQIHNLTRDVPFLGKIKNVATGRCLSTGYSSPGAPVTITSCDEASEFMYFRVSGQMMPLTNDEACVTKGDRLEWCEKDGGSEHRWLYSLEGQLYLETNGAQFQKGSEAIAVNGTTQAAAPLNSQCLTDAVGLEKTSGPISVEPCKRTSAGGLRRVPVLSSSDEQVWEWERYRPPASWTPPPVALVRL